MPAPAHSHRRERAFPPPNIWPSAARSVAARKLSEFLLACSLAFDSGRLLYGRRLRRSNTPYETQEVRALRIKRGKAEILVLLDLSMDKRLNDGTQKFPGNDVNDLRAHLIEDSLYDSLDKRGIRCRGLQWLLGGHRVRGPRRGWKRCQVESCRWARRGAKGGSCCRLGSLCGFYRL